MGHIVRDLDVALFKSDGTAVLQENNLLTLADATTYYAEIPVSECRVGAMMWSWAALLIAAITYESTNLKVDDGATVVAAGRFWFPEAGPGTTNAAAAIACAVQHFADFGARRLRAKIVVTTGGTAQLRGRFHGKIDG